MALLGEGVTPFTTFEELTSRLTGALPVVAVLGPSCTTPETLGMSQGFVLPVRATRQQSAESVPVIVQ